MGYNATFSEDPASFANSSTLAGYQAIVFLSNSDEILDTAQQKANLETYLVNGGGLVGIHSASAALFSTPWYGTAFGAFFDYHPTLQNATFSVVNDSHPSTSALPAQWNYLEEVYNFRSDPRATNVSVS
jgi:type 1 glutamine amidotransferase